MRKLEDFEVLLDDIVKGRKKFILESEGKQREARITFG
jgi:hypothetical protein